MDNAPQTCEDKYYPNGKPQEHTDGPPTFNAADYPLCPHGNSSGPSFTAPKTAEENKKLEDAKILPPVTWGSQHQLSDGSPPSQSIDSGAPPQLMSDQAPPQFGNSGLKPGQMSDGVPKTPYGDWGGPVSSGAPSRSIEN